MSSTREQFYIDSSESENNTLQMKDQQKDTN